MRITALYIVEPIERLGDKAKNKHPLYATWSGYINRDNICDEWKDFETFKKEIGERPVFEKFLLRKDLKKKLSKSNYFWASKPGEKYKK